METATESKARRGFKISDIVIGAIFLAICVVLLVILLKQLNLKHEVSAATATADRIAADIQNVKPADVRSISTSSFRSNHSEANLQALFTAANNYAKGTRSIASKTVTNAKDSQNVGIVYQYTNGKSIYYIRIVATKLSSSHDWQVAGISGGNDRTKLEANR